MGKPSPCLKDAGASSRKKERLKESLTESLAKAPFPKERGGPGSGDEPEKNQTGKKGGKDRLHRKYSLKFRPSVATGGFFDYHSAQKKKIRTGREEKARLTSP